MSSTTTVRPAIELLRSSLVNSEYAERNLADEINRSREHIAQLHSQHEALTARITDIKALLDEVEQ